jgi:hypothetical protein
MMTLEAWATELSIYAVALSKAPGLFDNMNFQRLEYLHKCLEIVKSWFGLFITLPAAEFIGFPLHIYRQMAHCIVSLHRLGTCEVKDWDVGTIS